MNIIDINTVDKPLDPNSFDILKDNTYPYFILGFQIKNEYDQLRHSIPTKYKPADIVHFSHYPDTTPYFFRGIEVLPSYEAMQLYNRLTESDTLLFNDYNRDIYKQILQENKFSADYCSQWLKTGIYPIDGHHIDKMDCKIDLNELYEDIFKDKNIPYFQSIGYIVLFILDNKNSARGTNTKVVESLLSNQKRGS